MITLEMWLKNEVSHLLKSSQPKYKTTIAALEMLNKNYHVLQYCIDTPVLYFETYDDELDITQQSSLKNGTICWVGVPVWMDDVHLGFSLNIVPEYSLFDNEKFVNSGKILTFDDTLLNKIRAPSNEELMIFYSKL